MPRVRAKKSTSLREKPAVVLSVTVPAEMFERLSRCRRGEGFLTESEVIRVGTNEFLKKGGY